MFFPHPSAEHIKRKSLVLRFPKENLPPKKKRRTESSQPLDYLKVKTTKNIRLLFCLIAERSRQSHYLLWLMFVFQDINAFLALVVDSFVLCGYSWVPLLSHQAKDSWVVSQVWVNSGDT